MKLGGGCLIALAVGLAWMVTTEFLLVVVAGRGPFDWAGFLSLFWPSPLPFALGVYLWQRKPKNWMW